MASTTPGWKDLLLTHLSTHPKVFREEVSRSEGSSEQRGHCWVLRDYVQHVPAAKEHQVVTLPTPSAIVVASRSAGDNRRSREQAELDQSSVRTKPKRQRTQQGRLKFENAFADLEYFSSDFDSDSSGSDDSDYAALDQNAGEEDQEGANGRKRHKGAGRKRGPGGRAFM